MIGHWLVMVLIVFSVGLVPTEGQTDNVRPCECSALVAGSLNVAHCTCDHVAGNFRGKLPITSNIQILILTCTTNRNGTIGSFAFDGVPGIRLLRQLYIIGCPLSRIERFAFFGVRRLSVLTLSYVSSPTLMPDWLESLPALTFLDLSLNNFTRFNNRDFCHVPRLRTLNMSFNSIGDDASFGFVGRCRLSALVFLDISSNPLGRFDQPLSIGNIEILVMNRIVSLATGSTLRLPASMFCNNRNIRLLWLSGNNLDENSDFSFLRCLPRLQTFVLTSNNMGEIRDTLFQFNPGLQSLYLHSNRIGRIQPGAFRRPQRIQILGLNDNKLQVITNETFGSLTNLRALYIRRNNIHTIQPGGLPDTLQNLTMDGNQLNGQALQALTNLEVVIFLDLHNGLAAAVDVTIFRKMARVAVLELHDNTFRVCQEDSFVSNTQLRYLDLSNNSMRMVNRGCFNGLTNLRVLFLENNLLVTLAPDLFVPLPSLVVVWLHGNRLTGVDFMDTGLYQLRLIISLHNNRLVCNCAARDLQEWLRDQFLESENVLCAGTRIRIADAQLGRQCRTP